MKTVFYLIVLAALAYGGKYYYDTYLAESVNNTISRTADFATEKLQKEMDKIKEEHKQIIADHKELMKEHKQIMKDHQRYDKEFKSCNCPM